MRKLYFFGFLLLLMAAKTFGQAGQVFNLNKLPKQDTLLSGWKFKAGDNPAWANRGFDDSKWQAIDPGQDITGFTALKQAGIGWIRLHIRTGSGLKKKQLAAWVFQYTASEVYLDGRLLKKYGQISNDPANTVALCPTGDLFNLPLDTGEDHVIAVRLGYQSSVPYNSPDFTPLPAFSLNVNSFPAALANFRQTDSQNVISSNVTGAFAGIFFIISLIYFIYYFFERRQRINLYYCIFSINQGCACFFITLFYDNVQNVAAQMWVGFFVAFFFASSFLSMLLSVYALYDYRSRTAFKILLAIAFVFFVYMLFSDILGFILATNVFTGLCMLEGARVSVLAFKTKRKDALVIFPGLVISIVLIIWAGVLNQTDLLSIILTLLSFLGFPLAMTVYQGIQNAKTNQKLRASLIEVQTLSAQNLLKEQEKQQILADQNIELEKQVTERTAELNQSLYDLKFTQNQLIQSEKMASLGELTAGIAHEIQNPLNFVNNFSDVNRELLVELKDEIDKGNVLEVKAIADDVIENEQKINLHGKRADAIVKSMLQHSQTGKGTKEPTDINSLAEGSMQLAYHAMQSKHPDFGAEMFTHFDAALINVSVIPQDIGKVLLNLFNNAFYAVNQKQKTASTDYKPEVTVTTTSDSGNIIIKVKDNGNGIPDAIKDKIMQPFFTTKPTGEGTGLGLSLSYDIVVKGHGGTIAVNSVESEGSEFKILLPLNTAG